MNSLRNRLNLPHYIRELVEQSPHVLIPSTRDELIQLSLCGSESSHYDVAYDINDTPVVEASVTRCKNGIVVNYPEDYMRRRDPDCLFVADPLETDKPRYEDCYQESFDLLRQQTFDWLKSQELLIVPFKAGGSAYGYDAILIAPKNAAFFAAALSDMQGFLAPEEIDSNFTPKATIFLAPPFRHTHFHGKQIVVHNRLTNMHELYSYNLYPGPSAKKGIYGVLLNIGEAEGWVTVHASTVKVITPYDNEIIIMHEGASGGGKSEMLETAHKEMDGRCLVGKNTVTDEKTYITLKETCVLHPVTDDMALCHPEIQNDSKKLVVTDAEQGWFLRLDHMKEYGTSPQHEKIFTHPQKPLIFLNLQAVPDSTCLVWEHTLDSTRKPCPNPRVILPRELVPNIIEDPVEIDVRSFGVRTPPCTKEKPSYGILGMFHILPPALAWIWRLVAPRGYNNPSITDTKGMTSEGVGSYWPFATGKMVEQANLLLEQIIASGHTRYVLIPNQHIGAYEVGFMPQWIAREYIARRGSAKFRPENLKECRCSLLGYSLDSLKVDGQYIPKIFLQPEMQAEVGVEGYLAGADMLVDFFKKELKKYATKKLHPLGHNIIQLFLNNSDLKAFEALTPTRF